MSSGGEDGGDDDGSDEDEDEDEQGSSGEEESGESEPDEVDDEAADKVRKKIEDALKASGVGVGEDNSEDSSDEELMDDDQMMALDDTLAEIFRTRTNKRKSKQGPLRFSRHALSLEGNAQLNTKGSMPNEKQRISRTESSISWISMSNGILRVLSTFDSSYHYSNSQPKAAWTNANCPIKRVVSSRVDSPNQRTCPRLWRGTRLRRCSEKCIGEHRGRMRPMPWPCSAKPVFTSVGFWYPSTGKTWSSRCIKNLSTIICRGRHRNSRSASSRIGHVVSPR